jgi:hypothetical protein
MKAAHMKYLNWRARLCGTADLLKLVPGLRREAFWNRKRAVEGAAPAHVGSGQDAEWTGEDLLEATTLHELARLGVVRSDAWRIWLMVRKQMILRHAGGPIPTRSVILASANDGVIVAREYDEADDDGAGLDHPGAPVVFVVVRIGELIARVEGRIRAAAPVVAS